MQLANGITAKTLKSPAYNLTFTYKTPHNAKGPLVEVIIFNDYVCVISISHLLVIQNLFSKYEWSGFHLPFVIFHRKFSFNNVTQTRNTEVSCIT